MLSVVLFVILSLPGTFYFVIARYLYVDFENEELGCVNQKQFSAGGAGALPIYWDKVYILAYYFHILANWDKLATYIFLPFLALCHIFLLMYWDKVCIHPLKKKHPPPSFILFFSLLPSE